MPALVTDVEGTTTPISFVAETLFPYARRRLPDFVRRNAALPEIAAELDAVRRAIGDPAASQAAIVETLIGWIDEDRKATPLKTLQGLIWAEGYRAGTLVSEIYDDVPGRLRDWRRGGMRLFGYSSGSSAAQRLIFGHSRHGDLVALFEDFFDTRIGGKKEAESYAALARLVGLPAGEILFLSDNEAELDAAAQAGIRTACLDRDGEDRSGRHPTHRDFTTIEPATILRGTGAAALREGRSS